MDTSSSTAFPVLPLILADLVVRSARKQTAASASVVPTATLPYPVVPQGDCIAGWDSRQSGAQATIDNTMVKAIARAFRWQRLLKNGTYGCLEEIAKAERICASFVGRIIRLALLAPAIVEAVLAGKQPANLTLKDPMVPFPPGGRDLRRSGIVGGGWPPLRSVDRDLKKAVVRKRLRRFLAGVLAGQKGRHHKRSGASA